MLEEKTRTYHGEILERPCGFDVFQCFLQILQLRIHLALRLLRALYSLRLERLNGVDLAPNIVLLDLKAADLLLNIVDDSLVLEDGTVVGEVDGLGLS